MSTDRLYNALQGLIQDMEKTSNTFVSAHARAVRIVKDAFGTYDETGYTRVMEAIIKEIEPLEIELTLLKAERAAEMLSNTKSLYSGTHVMQENARLTARLAELENRPTLTEDAAIKEKGGKS